jgi:divalent metal cation (Fe/Co/Zn/Cd) transporter
MGWGMVRQSVGELTDAAKGNEDDVADVRYLALRIPGVQACSAVRVRRLGPYSAGDVQIVLANPDASLAEALAIKDRVRGEVLHHMPQLREIVIELGKPDDHHRTQAHRTGDK